MSEASAQRTITDEVAYARDLIARIIDACPRRMPTSDDERRAQELVAETYGALGAQVRTQEFRFNANIYANLALHFGLGFTGAAVGAVSPLAGAGLCALAGTSYLLDTTRRAFVLRRLFPWGTSRNVVATLPAQGEPRLRVVFVSHVDAAFTGVLFQPDFVRRFGAKPGPLYKSLRVATGSLFALAALGLVQAAVGRSLPLDLARAALAIPSLLATLLNLDVVLRNTIVPGANDNLSGVAGGGLLLDRLRHTKPADVEVVVVATGSEEASLGGADALARAMDGVWSRENTVIVGIDGLTNGELRYFLEGEVVPVPLDPRLRALLDRVSASEDRFRHVVGHDIPVGGTDAIPFAVRGWPAVTIGCLDPALGMPRGYHTPADNVENLEAEAIPLAVDYAEAVFRAVCDADDFRR